MVTDPVLIEVLDTKFKHVKSVRQRDFLPELAGLLRWLANEPIVSDHLEDMLNELEEARSAQRDQLEELINSTGKALRALAVIESSFQLPPPDAQRTGRTQPPKLADFYSEQHISNLLSSPTATAWVGNAPSHENPVFNWFFEKLKSLPESRALRPALQEPLMKVIHLRDSYFALKSNMTYQQQSSPAIAYQTLAKTTAYMYPPPVKASSLTEYNWKVLGFSPPDRQLVTELLEGGLGDHLDEFVEEQRAHLERLHVGLRGRIGQRYSLSRLLHRYRERVTLFDRDRLWDLACTQGKGAVNASEHKLTQDVAKYLFDQGVPTQYRVKHGVRESDLVGVEHGLLVEAKVYKASQRSYVRSGYAQLYGYLNDADGTTRETRDGVLLVFRLGGPTYDLPRVVRANRFRMHSILVDLTGSDSGGSRQGKLRTIAEDEILKTIREPDGKAP